MMTEVLELIQATIAAHIAPDAQVVAVQQRAGGQQGFSGAAISYYDVIYAQADTATQVTLVTKDAQLIERLTLAWLNEQGLAAPFSYTYDLKNDAPALVCMQYIGGGPPSIEPARKTAQALAAIHAAAIGQADELPWLPRADLTFAREWLIDGCWRRTWQSVLDGREYIAPGGRLHGPIARGGAFATEFGAYTRPLEDAAARFVRAIAELWAEGDSLTLIHADFHNDQVRADGDRAYVIDWDFAHYGPLYVDLPNYFTREEALLYRDVLADLGHAIPSDVFLARYDAIRPYPGFKYFSIGLYNWCYGDPPHQRDSVLHFIDMVL